jgi:ElaB/YqjD/DUF883 family membrane-anchored ribosome-binding protein
MDYDTTTDTPEFGEATGRGSHLGGSARRFTRAAADRVDAIKDQAGELTDRAERLAARARARADDVVDAIDRTRLPERTRSYPLAALGVAAGIGFMMAGSSEHRITRTVKGQLRGLLVAGLLASLRDEAEGLIRAEISGLFRGRRGD